MLPTTSATCATGTLLAGDACGVRMPGASYVLPVSPPPDITVEGWHDTIAEISRRQPERLALIHFGVHDDVDVHLDRLGRELDGWAERVRGGMSEDEFVAAGRADAGRRRRLLRPGGAVLAVLGRPAAVLGHPGVVRQLGPLREREFRLLFAGRTISQAGSAMAPVALAFAVLDLTGSTADLGIVLAVGRSR